MGFTSVWLGIVGLGDPVTFLSEVSKLGLIEKIDHTETNKAEESF
jgi:hypothetical protein